VIASTAATVGPGGRLEEVRCAPPLTLRRVRGDEADVCELCLIGTAAGPLAGDELSLTLEVRDGARAALRAAGAHLAQGRGGGSVASLSMAADVGARAELYADPGPLILCAGSRVDVSVRIALAGDADVEWRELIVLGRAGEPPGAATLRWDVTRGGRPVLRQLVDLADPVLRDWPGMTAGARVLGSALLAGPALTARTIVAAPTAVAQRLDQHAVLVTVLGRDAAETVRCLDELVERVRAIRPA
jgi:urease accessory protein